MTFWNHKKVLVTAGHGFTGSHLCRELLAEGASVTALVKPHSSTLNLRDILNQIQIVQGDVCDVAFLSKIVEGVEYCFHPAAVVPVMDARKNPEKAFQTNAVASFNFAQLALQKGVKRFLHVSTCHVYGNQPESALPLTESVAPIVNDLYAASKYAAEIFLRPLVVDGGEILFSRAFAKYGPGQGSQFLIPRIITQLLENKTPALGSPKPTRDYSYIKDIVRGYMLILEKGQRGEIYHLSSEVERSVKEVFDTIAAAVGYEGAVQWNESLRPHDILRLYGSSQKARKELGWKPEVSFVDGIKRTVESFRTGALV